MTPAHSRIIDTHAHLWQRARTPQPWINPTSMAIIDQDFWVDDLVAVQSEVGIDGAILVQSSNSSQETADLLALAGTPAVRGVVGWIDLEADVPAQLAAIDSRYLVGIRHLAHQDPDPAWLVRPGVDFASLAAADLPFDLVVHPHQLAVAAEAVAANPATQFVLDHLGNPPVSTGELDGWRSGVARLAEFDNVTVKLSGLTLQTNWTDWDVDDLREPIDTALDLFGPARLLFGSDWPLVMLASSLASWIDIVREFIPTEHHDAIFSGNAERVYLGERHA